MPADRETQSGDASIEGLINGDRAFRAMRDRWWLLVIAPLLAIAAVVFVGRFEPYHTSVQATVILPGDTEIPGNAERPELMVLDDLPTLIRSRVFAEGVAEAIVGSDITVDEIQQSLDGSRYSRIATVSISGENQEDVESIAFAVEQQLAVLINRYLIADEGDPATVRVINPAGPPTRDNDNQLIQVILAGGAGFVLGTVLATIAGPRRTQVEPV